MAQNILMTSLSAADTDLPVRFFSAKNESGLDYMDALLDTEAGIKTVLSRYNIDKIIVIGSAGSFDEGADLEPVSLRHGSTPDKASSSTYGMLRDRISQYADGMTLSGLQEDESLPEEVREKLIRFIRDFLEKSPKLKTRELSRLFDELTKDGQLDDGFWTALFNACPELSDNTASCKQWVKRYLYKELDPSLKTRFLPDNDRVCMHFIPEAEFEDSGQLVDNMMDIGKSVVEDNEDVNLYITLNSDDAADTLIVMNMLDILTSMPESSVHLMKIFTIRRRQKRMTNIIRDDTDGFGVTELFHAIRAFLNYGKADMIVDIWKKSGESNESVAKMIYAMRDVDVGLSMCNIPEVERGILSLQELFKSEKFWRESGYYGVLFSLIAERIREDYGVLLEGDGDINFIEMVKWAYRHQFYQQTLTLIESRTPENLVKSGIFYYCDDEAHEDQVKHLFAEQRLKLRPYEYFKIDQIDHYFIKSYDRSNPKRRGGRGDDPQQAYAALRTQSVNNQDPSQITGFTACENLDTLQDVLFAYYHVGFVRNKISHADSNTMERKNQQASGSDDISALVWMKDSIDIFIENYEKAMAEVHGKNPNVIIITGEEVREVADSMRNDRGSYRSH